eukprot:6212963-Pleurochrysis_carterae.AAC.2
MSFQSYLPAGGKGWVSDVNATSTFCASVRRTASCYLCTRMTNIWHCINVRCCCGCGGALSKQMDKHEIVRAGGAYARMQKDASRVPTVLSIYSVPYLRANLSSPLPPSTWIAKALHSRASCGAEKPTGVALPAISRSGSEVLAIPQTARQAELEVRMRLLCLPSVTLPSSSTQNFVYVCLMPRSLSSLLHRFSSYGVPFPNQMGERASAFMSSRLPLRAESFKLDPRRCKTSARLHVWKGKLSVQAGQ